MFYFGMMGLFISTLGVFTGIYVLHEWLQGINHIPLTILTVLLVVVGIEIFMFGMISDMLLVFHGKSYAKFNYYNPSHLNNISFFSI